MDSCTNYAMFLVTGHSVLNFLSLPHERDDNISRYIGQSYKIIFSTINIITL